MFVLSQLTRGVVVRPLRRENTVFLQRIYFIVSQPHTTGPLPIVNIYNNVLYGYLQ